MPNLVIYPTVNTQPCFPGFRSDNRAVGIHIKRVGEDLKRLFLSSLPGCPVCPHKNQDNCSKGAECLQNIYSGLKTLLGLQITKYSEVKSACRLKKGLNSNWGAIITWSPNRPLCTLIGQPTVLRTWPTRLALSLEEGCFQETSSSVGVQYEYFNCEYDMPLRIKGA